jgi:hypothetical protein
MLKSSFWVLFFFGFSCMSVVAFAAGVQTLQYSVVSNGRVAGSEVDKYSADGHVDCAFEFNDRGRGPKIEARYLFGKDGLPLRLDVS